MWVGVVWTFLLSSILSLLCLPLFGRRPDIDWNTVSKGRLTQNNQPTNYHVQNILFKNLFFFSKKNRINKNKANTHTHTRKQKRKNLKRKLRANLCVKNNFYIVITYGIYTSAKLICNFFLIQYLSEFYLCRTLQRI